MTPERGPLHVAVAACLTIALVAACGPPEQRGAAPPDPREATWEILWSTQSRVYPVLWGAAPDPAAVRDARAVFDCTWDGMLDQGLDPAPDFACWNRRLDVFGACAAQQPPGDSLRRCLDRSEAVCPLSPGFEPMARRCRPRLPFAL